MGTHRTYDCREDEGNRLLGIRMLFSLPPGRRDEKVPRSWREPGSRDSLLSLFSTAGIHLCR